MTSHRSKTLDNEGLTPVKSRQSSHEHIKINQALSNEAYSGNHTGRRNLDVNQAIASLRKNQPKIDVTIMTQRQKKSRKYIKEKIQHIQELQSRLATEELDKEAVAVGVHLGRLESTPVKSKTIAPERHSRQLRKYPTTHLDRNEELKWMLENSPYIAGAKPEEKQQFVGIWFESATFFF